MRVRFDGNPAAQAYAKAFRRLRQLEGFDQQTLLRAEAGSILKQWAGRTKVSTAKEANLRARLRAEKRAFGYTDIKRNPYGITVNTGRRDGFPGEVWYRTPNKKFQQAGVVSGSGTFTPSWIHFRDHVWHNIQLGAQAYASELKAILPLAEKSVGLARQSVIQIADDLGIDLNRVQGQGVSGAGIAKARAAIAANGRSYKNGRGTQGGDGTRCYVELMNRLPYGSKIEMDRTLAGVLAGRAKYIETSYAKGAFNSMKSAARAFPNLFNTSGLTVSN